MYIKNQEFSLKKISVHLDQVNLLSRKSDYTDNISCLTGNMSKALFYSYYSLLKGVGTNIEEINESIINHCTDQINSSPTESTNVDGLAGFGWGISHLSNLGFLKEDQNDFLEDVDSVLSGELDIAIGSSNYDLFYGSVGFGNYFIERFHTNKDAKSELTKIISTLYKLLETGGVNALSSKKNQIERTIDFSFSHGLSSILVFITKCYNLNIMNSKCETIITKIGCYILDNSNYFGRKKFPDCIVDGLPSYSPLRWCHGEIGIAYSLAFAGKSISNNEFLNNSRSVALGIAKIRDAKNESILSSTICHGTLGVAVTLRKISTIIEDQEITDAAEFWYEKSCEMMESNEEYKYLDLDGVYKYKTGILFGIEGIGLCLISELNNTLNGWQGLIL